MITRAVPLTEEQYLFIEDLGKEFMRAKQHETATKLLAIALAWRVSPEVVSERGLLNGDDRSLSGTQGSGNRPRSETTFACNVDESAGLADVVELHEYGKRVGA